MNGKNKTPVGHKVFKGTPVKFRSDWQDACRRLGYDPGPPHALRHTGPSFDVLVNYRPLPAVKTRGRWLAKTSALRYAETHLYIDADSRVLKHIRRIGRGERHRLGVRPEKAPA